MTTTNPHLKTLVLAGALAIVGAALAMFMLSRQSVGTSTSAAPPIVKRHTVTPAPAPATRPVTAHPAQPKVVVHTRQPPLVDPIVRAALAVGLPGPVANAFAGHTVVVVSLYDPASTVDATSTAEARAGAQLAGAAFVGIDTRREGATGALVRELGVLRSPTTLVYALPKLTLATRFDGFADRETVAQAATNADPGNASGDAAQTAWARGANAVCDRAAASYSAVLVATTPASPAAEQKRLDAISKRFIADLTALPAPAGRDAEVTQFVAAETRNISVTQQLRTTRGDNTVHAMTVAIHRNSSAEANTLALTLGATHCAGAL